MALHRFLGIEIGVPEPEALDACYAEIGLVGGGGRWGTADQPDQLAIAEAPYRQLRSMRIGCESEADLDALRRRLDALGIAAQAEAGRVACLDPSGHWQVVVEVAVPVGIGALQMIPVDPVVEVAVHLDRKDRKVKLDHRDLQDLKDKQDRKDHKDLKDQLDQQGV